MATRLAGAPLSTLRTLFLGVVFVVAMVAGGWMVQRGSATVSAPKLRGPVLFEQVRRFVEERYFDTVSASRAYRMAIDGTLRELGDPYTVFLPPDRLTQLNERTTGNYAGLGLQVDLRDGSVIVVNPITGGPGERAGILTGDRIIEIDGQRVMGWTPEEVQRLLRGRPGSRISITIEHPGVPDPVQLTLIREIIHQSAIRQVSLLTGNVGYVMLKVFSDSTEKEVRNAIDSLVEIGATSLIMDVRGNPGGLLEQGVRVTDLFLDSGDIIVRTRGRVPGSDKDYVDTLPQRWPKLPVSILVDDKSASAAEIFAGALQDNDRAALIGITTYGKGSAQTIYHLGTDGALKITTAKWYTPLGRAITQKEATDDVTIVAKKPPARPTYRTPSGRLLVGGGGVTPDLVVGDSIPPIENIAFMHALGRRVGQFRDALTSYALAVKASGEVKSPDFAVTQAMLDDVYKRMVARNVDVPRMTYDDAKALVSRLLSYEVDRYVFGAAAEFYRKASDDKVIITAQRVMNGASSQANAFERIHEVVKESAAVVKK